MPLFRKNHSQPSTFNSPLAGNSNHPSHSTPASNGAGKQAKFPIDKLVLGVIGIAVVLFIAFNAYSLLGGGSLSLPGFGPAKSTKSLEITVISAAQCEGACFNLKLSVEELIQASLAADKDNVSNLTLHSLDVSDPRALALVSKYSITKLPVAIFAGDISVLPSVVSTALVQSARNYSNSLVVEPPEAPYFDLSQNKVVGLINATAVYSASCTKCTTVDTIIGQLEATGVKFSNVADVELATPDARELIKKYNLTMLPAIVFSNELENYPRISTGWSTLGYIHSDGSYVLSKSIPPVLNLTNNKTEGLVSVTYLVDKTCEKCYNVSMHNAALRQSGVYIENENTVDVSEQQGRALLDLYNITQVPIVVLSPEANKYAILLVAWPQVGTVEKDGYFVFRNLARVPGITYRDLQTGEVMTSQAAAPTAGSSSVGSPQ